jgi:hypothetical protein
VSATPVARGVWCWPALLPGVAVVLDAIYPLPFGEAALGLLWLDIAALTCLVWATVGSRRARHGDWATPMDGRAVAAIVIALLHVIAQSGAGAPMQWLHQFAAIGVCYYALGARLRREPLAPDAVWPSFAMVGLALSAFTLAHVTAGTEALAAASAQVDVSWASNAGTAKTLVLVTILCAGRAAEPGARALWPVTALVGALAVVLHGLSGGLGLRTSALSSLDEPFYFGTAIVLMMFMFGLARAAWQLVRDRPAESARWRSTAVTFVVAVGMLIFGGTSGGEGVRTVLVLAAAATIASTFAPRAKAGAGASLAEAEPPARKAA